MEGHHVTDVFDAVAKAPRVSAARINATVAIPALCHDLSSLRSTRIWLRFGGATLGKPGKPQMVHSSIMLAGSAGADACSISVMREWAQRCPSPAGLR